MFLRAWAVRGSVHHHLPSSPTTTTSRLLSTPAHTRHFSAMAAVRIAVVGDVHGDWDPEEDTKALHHLQPDLVLFTGDFGNENVELVKSIASLDMPKVAILGNHDCWYTYDLSKRKSDRLQVQLESLSEEHVGYRCLDFPMLKLSVVGGRPFSCGGDKLFRPRLLSSLYGVNDMEGSAKKIYEAAMQKPNEHSLIFLAHNGPSGLGSKMNDICGRDWVSSGGDHGDPDLALAISDVKESTRSPIQLVVFGHMHKQLAYGGLRKMLEVESDGTIYLNGAIVPRVMSNPAAESEMPRDSETDQKDIHPQQSVKSTLRAFTVVVDMLEGRVEKILQVWVLVSCDGAVVAEENVLYKNQ